MQVFTLPALLEERVRSERGYHEFLRVPTMSAGVYHLGAGSADLQQPHTEDELYYVVAGRASLRVGDEQVAVAAGTLVFVEAQAPHRFQDIIEDLMVLVFFAPAEYTGGPASPGQ